MVNIKGTSTAMVVPFKENNSIDYELYHELCTKQAKAGNHVVSPGTTTESPTLTPEEHLRLIEIGVEAVKNVNLEKSGSPVLMIAGVGSNSTKEAIEYCEKSVKLGADAGMSVVPYYNMPSQEGHLNHQIEVAKVGLPIMMYNIPKRSGSGMHSDTILKAFEMSDSIVSLKAADGVNEDLIKVLKYKPEHVTVLSGDDTLAHPMLSIGASGLVSVSANLVPERINEYIKNFNSPKSLDSFMELFPLMSANMSYGNPVTIKEAMYILRNELKIPSFKPVVRQPLVRINNENCKKLEKVLLEHFFNN